MSNKLKTIFVSLFKKIKERFNYKQIYILLAIIFIIKDRYFYFELFWTNFGTWYVLLPFLFIFLYYWHGSEKINFSKSTLLEISGIFLVILLLSFDGFDSYNRSREEINASNYFNCVVSKNNAYAISKDRTTLITSNYTTETYKKNLQFIHNNSNELDFYTNSIMSMEAVNTWIKIRQESKDQNLIKNLNEQILLESNKINGICEKFYDSESDSKKNIDLLKNHLIPKFN